MRHIQGDGISPWGSPEGGHQQCLGVVISLPPALSAEIDAWRRDFGGPDALVIPPHITLVSGNATSEWEPAAAHVRSVAAASAPFTVRLRGTGSFRPVSPVVFLNVVSGAEDCAKLHHELQSGPLAHDQEFPYHPHVTIAHDLPEADMNRAAEQLSGFDDEFTVESIGLFDHDEAGNWSLSEELRLGSDDPQG
ncbi:2'-5' RNA ligase family protein [Paeniglutamicibacter cryotolerans]|uniref:2'-5' RNA ligase n=1 Tax=Paeniglutamicibacter cryotolerans TaxID=670079 RepID=A0A839QJ91_9MICC|nr:2'-5' RNA ligase family protein [Paeniglutamicibacter cryotolerans]MBB2995877.1 2'-5' RNA ligase [Paeniglutamicibacter cryotolerans]